jgi:hypothetical protein
MSGFLSVRVMQPGFSLCFRRPCRICGEVAVARRITHKAQLGRQGCRGGCAAAHVALFSCDPGETAFECARKGLSHAKEACAQQVCRCIRAFPRRLWYATPSVVNVCRLLAPKCGNLVVVPSCGHWIVDLWCSVRLNGMPGDCSEFAWGTDPLPFVMQPVCNRHLVEDLGHDPNEQNVHGMTALHFGVMKQSPQIVKFLVSSAWCWHVWCACQSCA